ncbi:MAG: baseplate J/gp47 family protein [Eubacteriales bacterium]|nr:baseplate J/gp47 family protein [Clostridia bacterium]MDZ4042925.1 baseplate J/gp47 family protein [Eubacteriales bacterium]
MKPEDLLPIKTFTELMDDTRTRFWNMQFRITNWRPGGVFYSLVAAANQGLADLYKLLKDTSPQLYVNTATGEWLDLKAAEYEVYRKLAQKTRGNATLGRNEPGDNVVIAAGTIVSTAVDRYGEKLQYIVTERAVLEDLEVLVPVEAEFAGARHNVGSGQINQLVTPVAGIDYVTNTEGWITREGTDDETDESLRARTKNAWSKLSVGGGRDAYIAWAQDIPGVIVVRVSDEHPRGQGTVDVIITGSAGLPTQDLIDQVQAHIDERKPLLADVLALGPVPVPVAFDVTLIVHPDYGGLAEIQARAEEIIDIMFRYGDTEETGITKVSPEFGVIRAQVVANLMTIEHVVNVNLVAPAVDVAVAVGELAVKGTVDVTTQRVS